MSTQIRVLKTDGDHAVAVARLSELMDIGPEVGSVEEAELGCWPCSSSRMSRPSSHQRRLTRSKPSCFEWISSGWHRRTSRPTSAQCPRSLRCSAVNAR